MNNFKSLLVWQKSMSLAEIIYNVTKNFPNDERFGLTSQIRRSSVSIPSNISEGAGRFSKKDFSHFLAISLGSCYELETQLILAHRFGYIDKINYSIESINEKISEVQKMIIGLKKSIIL